MRVPCLGLLLLLSALPLAAGPADLALRSAASTYRDLEFANVDGVSLKLDLYLPDAPPPHPLVISIHGGAWVSGERSESWAVYQIPRGYAVANIDYRLAPGAIFPAQIHDCKAAVRWLRAHAAKYGLDPDRFAVMGYSAGGHLAALLGTSGGDRDLEGATLGNAAVSSRVQAIIDYYGPTDLLRVKGQSSFCTPYDADDPEKAPSLLIGCPIQACPEKTERANPLRYISADDPPFLILQGKSDCLVPWQQSQILHDALLDGGIDSTLVLLPHFGHADPRFLFFPIQKKVNDFLDTHLKRDERRRPVRR